MQGEGDYTAARRHRDSVESFVAGGNVEKAAKPANSQEAEALKQAEKQGRDKARK
jgi:hypothetical protein